MYYQNWRSMSKVFGFQYCWNIYITDKWMPEVPQSGLPLELLVWFWSHPNGELKYETIMHTHTHTHTHTHMHTPVSSVWSKSRCGCCCFFFCTKALTQYHRQIPAKWILFFSNLGFPGITMVKYLPANSGDPGDPGSIPGLGKSPKVGNGNPLQYSCLENSMGRRAWWAIVHRVTKQ